MFKIKQNKNIQTIKSEKIAATEHFLSAQRKVYRVQTPLGFRSRTSVAYYNSYSNRIS